MGGVWIKAAETGALAAAGAGAVSQQISDAVGAFGQSLANGEGVAEAVEAGRIAAGSAEGWSAARAAMIETRLEQIAGYGLTPAQVALYREASESTFFAFAPSDEQAVPRLRYLAKLPRSAHSVSRACLVL